jgi:hypothetical protein
VIFEILAFPSLKTRSWLYCGNCCTRQKIKRGGPRNVRAVPFDRILERTLTSKRFLLTGKKDFQKKGTSKPTETNVSIERGKTF